MTTVLVCDSCNQAISDIVGGNLGTSRWRVFEKNPQKVAFELGDNFKLARNHWSKACALCSEAYHWMSSSWFEDSHFEPLESPRSTPYFYTYPKETPDRRLPQISPRLEICGTPQAESTASGKKRGRGVDFEFYRCGTHCDKPQLQQEILELDVELSPMLDPQLGTHKIDYSGSPEAMELMVKWSAECLRRHPRCAARKSNQLLPKRVLDLGPSGHSDDGLRYPRLVISNGHRARYACLSYRWGPPTQQYVTTRQNIHEHLTHIPMDRLPQTLRDAVKFARYMDIRYLWIDCLCIIQDDDSDWNEECKRMSDIYERSFFTISALGAENSVSGLFQSWNTSDDWRLYIRTRDGALLGMRVARPMLEYDLGRSSMSSRGWILQEKILSPALAHFGKKQIHWECLTGTTSELWATSAFPTNGTLKYFLHEVQRPGLELYDQSHFIGWYMLIQRYSDMALTAESDRLPAILGIARRFQQSFRATFAAGLRIEDLHRGLLWHRYGQIKLYGPSNSAGFSTSSSASSPSWSWINLVGHISSGWISFEWYDNKPKGTQISMKMVKRVVSNAGLRLVDAWTFSHPALQRGAIRGVLQVWGIVHKVRVVVYNKRTVVRRPTVEADKLPRTRSHGVHHASPLSPNPDIICQVDFECRENFDCHFLVVADWSFEDTYKGFFGNSESSLVDPRCFLLLKRVKRRRKYQNPLDLGQFKRIGMGCGVISHVEGLYGLSHDKKFLTII